MYSKTLRIDRMCQRVDVIIRITQYSTIFVKCPVCGRWGRPNRKRHNAFCISHTTNTSKTSSLRCSITHDVTFYKFIENVVHTIYHISAKNRQYYIRQGYLPIDLPTFTPNNNVCDYTLECVAQPN